MGGEDDVECPMKLLDCYIQKGDKPPDSGEGNCGSAGTHFLAHVSLCVPEIGHQWSPANFSNLKRLFPVIFVLTVYVQNIIKSLKCCEFGVFQKAKQIKTCLYISPNHVSMQ